MDIRIAGQAAPGSICVRLARRCISSELISCVRHLFSMRVRSHDPENQQVLISGVPQVMGHPRRHQDEISRSKIFLCITHLQPALARDEVKDLGGAIVQVQDRTEGVADQSLGAFSPRR